MYRRRHFIELKDRLLESRNKIQVLSGPRQVGKSTLMKQVLKEIDLPYLFVTGDDVSSDNNTWISETWNTARSIMKIRKYEIFILVIDEIHKIKNWSEAVKKEWDIDTFNDLELRVVILGSSRLLIKDGLTESLTGRYELIRMSHWSYDEMHDAFGFDLEQYIYYGGYPGGASFINNERRWQQYMKDSIIAPAIEKDILMTKVIYKPQLMKQLFELGCTYSGEEISFTKLLGQLQDAGNVTTLANYLTTLDESRLLCGMQKYANDNARKYNSIPKMMVYNTALLSALSNTTFEKTYITPKVWGRWVESAIGSYLLNKADGLDLRLYYWRENNDEVDFVIEKNKQCIAIEVKSGKRTINNGLSVFTNKFHPKHSFVVGSGGIPVEDFLTLDIENLFEL